MHTLRRLISVRSKYFFTVGYIITMLWAVPSRNRGLTRADSIELPLCPASESRRIRWAGCLARIRSRREVLTRTVFWWKNLKGLTTWNSMAEMEE
jgi:hypothetical protein